VKDKPRRKAKKRRHTPSGIEAIVEPGVEALHLGGAWTDACMPPGYLTCLDERKQLESTLHNKLFRGC